MTMWRALGDAVAGWVLILRGDAGWRERFRFSAPAVVNALVVVLFIAFLGVALGSTSVGMPSVLEVVVTMAALALPALALLVTLVLTRNMLRSPVPLLPIMVPGLYLVAAFILLEGALAMIAGPLALLSWLVLAWFVFRLARVATDWNAGVVAAFAVLTVAMLVAMRLGLYMVNAAASAI